MRCWLLISIALLASVLVVIAQPTDPDPDAVILTFDMRGGQKPRIADGPILQLNANGTVIVRATKPGDLPVITQLSPDEQVAFLKELVEEMAILSVTTVGIEEEIAMHDPPLRRVPHAPVTLLSIHLPVGSTSILVKGVSALAYRAPEAPSIQNLFRIQRHLMNFAKHVKATAG